MSSFKATLRLVPKVQDDETCVLAGSGTDSFDENV
jgi:hypothetical protein